MTEYVKSLYDDSISGDPNRRYEYFKGKSVASNNSVSYKAPIDCVIPVKVEPESSLCVKEGENEYEINFDGEKAMNARYFKVKAGNEISFLSDSKMFIGEPIALVQKNPHKHKLVLFILVDSFAQTVLEEEGFENLMPYTSKFFSDGLYMKECYCCSDWTLPACATVFTGKYPYEHKMVNPIGGKLQHDTFVKLFKDAGYLTSYFNSNWRMPPEYGYLENYDRGVYCFGQNRGKFINLIERMLDHLYAFSERDHFITLTIFDLHHHFFLDLPHEVAMQTTESIEEQAYRPNYERKPTETMYTPVLVEIYKKCLKFLDYKIQILYNFLSRNYSSDEYAVLLCADHGASFLSPPEFPVHSYTQVANGNMRNHQDESRMPFPFWKKMGMKLYKKVVPLYTHLNHYSFFAEKIKKTKIFKIARKGVQDAELADLQRRILSVKSWPHFQTSMQKVPLIICGSSIRGEQCDNLADLRSVYSIFFTLLSEKQIDNEMIKDICKRTYVYNESIYPGQTYKAKIIDDKYIFWFESNELVSINCTLDDLGGYSSLFSRETNKEILDKKNIIEKYNSIVQNHILSLRS